MDREKFELVSEEEKEEIAGVSENIYDTKNGRFITENPIKILDNE